MQTVNCRTVKDNRNAECVSEEPIVHTFIYSHQHYIRTQKHTHIHTHKLAYTRSTRDVSSQNCGNVLNAFKLLWEIRQMLFAK